MVYISKPDNIEENIMNNNPPFEFPTVCPECGAPLLMSDKNARCPMMMCKGRVVARAVNMVEKLGIFKGFSEESIKALGIDSFTSLYNMDCKKALEILGQANGMKFIDCLNVLKTKQIPDYIILGSLGFSGVSATKWATILNEVRLSEICHSNDGILTIRMSQLKGIGPKTAKQIINDRQFFMNDLLFIEQLPNVISTVHSKFKNTSGTKVRYSGVRDEDLVNMLQAKCNISSTAGLTKDTSYLIIPYVGYTSTKVSKALEYNAQGADIRIIPLDEFKDNLKHFIV
jgi:NAD-dependent DNA ligase